MDSGDKTSAVLKELAKKGFIRITKDGFRLTKKGICYEEQHEPPWWLPLCFAIPSIVISLMVLLGK